LAAIGPVEGEDIVGVLSGHIVGYSAIEKSRFLDALGSLGPDAKDALEKIKPLMYDTNMRVMPEAALAYYNISGDEKIAIDVLKGLFRNQTYKIKAAECIGGMGQGGESAIPELTAMLGENDENSIETALLALKGIGPSAASALPLIKGLVNHHDYLVTKAAKEAIEAITATE